MSDIREWLEELGLGQYADAFEAEQVSVANLPELTDGDLKGLGLPLGPRRTVIKAARTLDDAINPAKTAKTDIAHASRGAERRQLTVMFCDLVGSTALSEQLDPEDLRILMQAYQQACGNVIERYGGHVAQYLGDGLMTYFGWPHAHEDDAERAIRAGLDIVDTVKTVPAPAPLQVRVGIATGPVVVGETGAGDASVPRLAVGETPNLAARMQGLAAADHIVISPSTHRLIGGTFEVDDLGSRTLKGVAEPMHVWQVTGIAETEGRFEARGGRLTQFVGRDAEIAMIMERWQRAKGGEGQVVLLCGEPGIGKSRITQVLRERVADEPHNWLRYQCSPYHTNSALHPIIGQMERAAGFARDDTVEQKLDKLEYALRQSGPDIHATAALFAPLLNVDSSERYPDLNVSPQKQKDLTLRALVAQVVALAAKQPALMLFEDTHWIDPTTQEALDMIVPIIADQPMLVVITYRPEYEPPWSGLGHSTLLTLTRLGKVGAAAMVEQITGGNPLPAEVLDQIVAKTDGVPLFVEELTKTVIESGVVTAENGGYVLSGAITDIAIPSTLQDSLMARLDRMSPVKDVAQVGACIGREFSYELLAAVLPLSENEFQDSLTQLVNSEMIFRSGTGSDAIFTFKHALVQDAAYESLLKSRRQQLHTNVAKTLEQRFSDLVAAEPEVVARHYTAAGLSDRAVKHWLAAGQKALARFANAEASAHLSKGLNCLATLPESRERDEQELTLQTLLGFAFINYKGYGAPESGRAYSRASDLCRRLGDSEPLAPILLGLWTYYLAKSDFVAAGEMVKLCFAAAQDGDDPASLLVGHALGSATTLYLGDAIASLDHAEKGIALYDPDTHNQLAQRFGQNVGPLCADWGSWALWLLGYPDRAAEGNRQGLVLAEATKHPLSYATVLSHAAIYGWVRRDLEAAETHAEATIALTQEVGIPFRYIEALMTQGWALAEGDDAQRGRSMIRQGIKEWLNIDASRGMPLWLTMLAEAERRCGNTDSALATLEEAFAAIERTGERIWEPEIFRLKGVFLLDGGDARLIDTEASFEKAITIAQSQSTRSWELRAATSLAKLWHSQSKTRQAHDLLFPIYDWFTEGFDTPDVKNAKVLLDKLK
jgi:class 3 adenylate cyclase/predicted ATPase